MARLEMATEAGERTVRCQWKRAKRPIQSTERRASQRRRNKPRKKRVARSGAAWKASRRRGWGEGAGMGSELEVEEGGAGVGEED